MPRQLDVLIMENHRGAARQAEEALVAAGHRIHRCHRADDRGFPCVGVTDPGSCPMDEHIDVALLVRPRVAPRAGTLEEGVSCAIRSGVPLVEEGPDLLDPYAPWVAERVVDDADVVDACERAAEGSLDPLRAAIRDKISVLLQSAQISVDQVTCRIDPLQGSLQVHLDVDNAIDKRLEQALAVRVLDAVRTAGKTFGQVDVKVSGR